jgi:chromosomal replication initiation ATPase DnaA
MKRGRPKGKVARPTLSNGILKKIGIVADTVCRAYEVSFSDVLSRRRNMLFVMPRWAIANALFELVGIDNEDIASVLERERTAPHHMRASFKRELETNAKTRLRYEKIEKELRAKLNGEV